MVVKSRKVVLSEEGYILKIKALNNTVKHVQHWNVATVRIYGWDVYKLEPDTGDNGKKFISEMDGIHGNRAIDIFNVYILKPVFLIPTTMFNVC